MAYRATLPAEEQEAWDAWVESRPDSVKAVARRFVPWALYRLKTTNQIVTIHSYSENGTVTVDITGDHNLILFDRQVFGINPDDLEPCDWPEGPVGTLMSPEQVDANQDALRVLIRPDLFTLDANGRAVRKNN